MKVFHDARTGSYQVKSGLQLLIGGLHDPSLAKAILATMQNLRLNAKCSLAGSNLVYWKSLLQSLPPSSNDPNQPLVSVENLEWNFDNIGFQRRYEIQESDLRREIPLDISYVLNNQDAQEYKVTAEVKINQTVLEKSEYTVPAKTKKPSQVSKKIILIQVATSPTQTISVNLAIVKGGKTYRKSQNDRFELVGRRVTAFIEMSGRTSD